MKLRHKLTLSVLSAVLILLALLGSLSYRMSRRALTREIQANAQNLLQVYLLRLENRFQGLSALPADAALAVQSLQPSRPEAIRKLLSDTLWMHPEIYGATIAFEPGAFVSGPFAPYFHRGRSGLREVDLASPDYDYRGQEWYRLPLQSGKPLWTAPYLDTGGGGIVMVTYAYPFFREGKPLGVATADVSLGTLTGIVDGIQVGKSGYAILVAADGTVLSSRIGGGGASRSIAELARERGAPELERLGKRMTAGESGFIEMPNPANRQPAWVAFGPVQATGWSLAIAFPQDELLSELTGLHLRMTLVSIAGMLAVLAIVWLIPQRLGRPVGELAEVADRISRGDFSTRLQRTGSDDEVGTLTQAFGRMQDSLSETLTRLREEKEMFRVAFTGMSDGLAILDADWRLLQYNRAAEKLLDLPTKLPFLEHVFKRFESDHQLTEMDRLPDEQRTCRLSRRPIEGFGPLHLECTLVPIRDERGQVRQRVIHSRDITAQEGEERSKRSFISLISHKLFTPLAVLHGKLAMLKDGMLGGLSGPQQRSVADAAAQTRKLHTLIEALVNFGAADTSGLDRSHEPIAMGEFLGEIAAELARDNPEKRPAISVSVAEGAESFDFNRKYLRTMVHELIDNGIKFNQSDPVAIAVECRREGGRIAVSVQDNGMGIPPELRDRIFEKFYQIDRDFTGNVQGVGLGLTHVKLLADQFAGTIDVVSEPGTGSRFTLRLPFDAALPRNEKP